MAPSSGTDKEGDDSQGVAPFLGLASHNTSSTCGRENGGPKARHVHHRPNAACTGIVGSAEWWSRCLVVNGAVSQVTRHPAPRSGPKIRKPGSSKRFRRRGTGWGAPGDLPYRPESWRGRRTPSCARSGTRWTGVRPQRPEHGIAAANPDPGWTPNSPPTVPLDGELFGDLLGLAVCEVRPVSSRAGWTPESAVRANPRSLPPEPPAPGRP